ncbi:MAG TPA: hypothetical protein V6C88_10965 [Chroococcidiopsis sp.]
MANTPKWQGTNWPWAKQWGAWWLGACVGTALVQIVFDAIATLFMLRLGTEGMGPNPWVLALFRLLGATGGGLLQWAVLKQAIAHSRGWVAATGIGSALGLLASNGLWAATVIPVDQNPLESFLMPPTSVLPQFLFDGVYGAVLGIVQWLALRSIAKPAGAKQTGLLAWPTGWIGVSVVAVIANTVAIALIVRGFGMAGLDVGGSYDPVYWAIALVGALIYGAITGGFWTLHLSPAPSAPSPEP